MQLPEIDLNQLATSVSRPAEFFDPDRAELAIDQATLLLSLAMCRDDFPNDTTTKKLLSYAISEMAFSLYLGSEYQEVMANPFSSETIGSYTYSKRAEQVKEGDKTGLPFFDQAVAKYSKCYLEKGQRQVASGGILMGQNTHFAQISDTKMYAAFPADMPTRNVRESYGDKQ